MIPPDSSNRNHLPIAERHFQLTFKTRPWVQKLPSLRSEVISNLRQVNAHNPISELLKRKLDSINKSNRLLTETARNLFNKYSPDQGLQQIPQENINNNAANKKFRTEKLEALLEKCDTAIDNHNKNKEQTELRLEQLNAAIEENHSARSKLSASINRSKNIFKVRLLNCIPNIISVFISWIKSFFIKE